MTVASILKHKGGEVVTIDKGYSIIDVARLLREKRIGAVVVIGPNNRLEGILSERDVVIAVAEYGGSALERSVADLMTTNVRSCRLADSIEHVMGVMTDGRFRHLPVIEQGKLVGIVSFGDVVKRRIMDVETNVEALRQYIAAS